MEDLEQSGEKKLAELKERMMQRQIDEQKRAEQEMQVDALLKGILTQEAKTRLSNVRLVNQELYEKAIQAVLYLANAGQLSGKLNEEDLKALLSRLNAKKEITIKRK